MSDEHCSYYDDDWQPRIDRRLKMTSGKSDIIDIAATLHHETEKAFLVDAGLKEKIWLPKSQVENNDDGTFAMPEWLATEKGLI